MRIMYMARRFHCSTERFTLLLFALVSLSLGGCARDLQVVEKTTCSPVPIEVLQAVRDDTEIRGYASAHFELSQTPFLWDRMPSKMETCGVAKGGVKIVRSSSTDFDRKREFIVVEKMYFDDDAAFVEIGFPPTGKNGDVFLRKRAGKWVIVDKLLWVN